MTKGAIIIEGHVQGLSNTRSLGEIDIPVYIVDKNDCIARHSKFCKKFFVCPDYKDDAFADFLIDLAIKENIRDWVLIPSNDHAVYTISKNKVRLEVYYKIATPSLDIIENIYDKVQLLEIASSLGVPIPLTQHFTSTEQPINQGLKFPVLTKGRNGLSFYKKINKKALLANSETELKEQLKLIDSKYDISMSFTQELIPFDGTNKTISFTAFCDNGNIKAHWAGEKIREHPLQFGTATFAKSVYIKECFEQSKILLKNLNYTGVCEVEYLKDPRNGEYKLIEINPRTWLWVGLAKASGVDYAKMIYFYVNDINYSYPDSYTLNLNWFNPITDVIFSMVGILKGKVNMQSFISSVFREKKQNALFIKGDTIPGYAYLFNLISFSKNR